MASTTEPAAVVQAASEERVFEVLADEDIEELGFEPSTLPPGPVFVSRVDPGTWAEKQGVQVGDVLTKVNGRKVPGLSKGFFRQAMQHLRPVRLEFHRPAASAKPNSKKSREERRALRQAMQEQRVQQMQSLPRDFRSQVEGADAGLEGVDASAAAPSAPAVSDEAALEERASVVLTGDDIKAEGVEPGNADPQVGEVATASPTEPVAVVQAALEERVFEVLADDDIEELGFEPSTLPPGPVLVSRVDPGTWAEKQGVQVGDVLTKINGRKVPGLSKGFFRQAMQHLRPVRLEFHHPAPVVATTSEERVFEVLADEDIEELGFEPSTLPPGPVFVSRVDPGTWAEKQGVQVGDVLTKVNGRKVPGLSKGFFRQAMQHLRPVRLEFHHPAAAAKPISKKSREERRALRQAMQEQRVQQMQSLPHDFRSQVEGADAGLEEVDASAAAPSEALEERASGVLAGDDIEAEGAEPGSLPQEAVTESGADAADPPTDEVAATSLTEPTAAAASEDSGDVHDADSEAGPGDADPQIGDVAATALEDHVPEVSADEQVQEVVASRSSSSTSVDEGVFELTAGDFELLAGEEVQELGFHPSAMPPDSVFVRSVDPGSWAKRRGVRVGDELVEINGQKVPSLWIGFFRHAMTSVRPVRLTFRRHAAPVGRASGSSLGGPQRTAETSSLLDTAASVGSGAAYDLEMLQTVAETSLVGADGPATFVEPVQAVQAFNVYIEKPAGNKLGMVVDASSLRIVSLDSGGVLAVRGRSRDPRAPRIGDVVFEVNGRRAKQDIIDQLAGSQKLRMKLARGVADGEEAVLGKSCALADVTDDLGTCCIQLDRSYGGFFGMELNASTLEILSVDPAGLLEAWNRNHPSKAARPGDQIMEVNGQRSCPDVLDTLAKATAVDVQLRRRWSTSGVGDPGPAVRAAGEDFSVHLRRNGGEGLGLEVDGFSWEVISIRQAGALAAWNAANPTLEVLLGDQIIEVNGSRQHGEMTQALARAAILEITVRRRAHQATDAAKPAKETDEARLAKAMLAVARRRRGDADFLRQAFGIGVEAGMDGHELSWIRTRLASLSLLAALADVYNLKRLRRAAAHADEAVARRSGGDDRGGLDDEVPLVPELSEEEMMPASMKRWRAAAVDPCHLAPQTCEEVGKVDACVEAEAAVVADRPEGELGFLKALLELARRKEKLLDLLWLLISERPQAVRDGARLATEVGYHADAWMAAERAEALQKSRNSVLSRVASAFKTASGSREDKDNQEDKHDPQGGPEHGEQFEGAGGSSAQGEPDEEDDPQGGPPERGEQPEGAGSGSSGAQGGPEEEKEEDDPRGAAGGGGGGAQGAAEGTLQEGPAANAHRAAARKAAMLLLGAALQLDPSSPTSPPPEPAAAGEGVRDLEAAGAEPAPAASGEAAAERAEEESATVELLAGEDVDELGFSPSTEPPQTVRVSAVEPDSWAEQRGVQVGHELTKINGRKVTALGKGFFRQAMKHLRPIRIEFLRQAGAEAEKARAAVALAAALSAPDVQGTVLDALAGEDVGELGFLPSAAPPETVLVSAVGPGTWAEGQGLQAGDELTKIDGKKVTGVSKSLFGQAMSGSRPVRFEFWRREGAAGEAAKAAAEAAATTGALEAQAKLETLNQGF